MFWHLPPSRSFLQSEEWIVPEGPDIRCRSNTNRSAHYEPFPLDRYQLLERDEQQQTNRNSLCSRVVHSSNDLGKPLSRPWKADESSLVLGYSHIRYHDSKPHLVPGGARVIAHTQRRGMRESRTIDGGEETNRVRRREGGGGMNGGDEGMGQKVSVEPHLLEI